MKQDILLLSTLLSLALLTAFCGKSSTERTVANIPTIPTGTGLVADSETSMALVANNMDEATTAAAQGDSASDTSASLALAYPLKLVITQTRSCTVDTTDLSADVDITYSGSNTRTGIFGSTQNTASGTETRVWTNTTSSAQQVCGPLQKYVKIDWTSVSDVNGLHLVDTTQRSHTIVQTFERASRTLMRTLSDAEQGTRNITWATPSGATDTTTVTKTVDSTVTHTSTLTKVSGATVSLTATHATLAGTPFNVTVTRDTTGKILTLTKNGTMTITRAQQFYITNVYSNVLLTVASSDPCVPTSGTLTTNIYNSSTDTTPIKTYTITFGGSGPTIANDTTATTDFTSNIDHSCALVN